MSTMDTCSGIGQRVPPDVVPGPLDHADTAPRTPRGTTGRVVHVAGVHEAQPAVERDPPGRPQGLRRGVRYVAHLEVRVERGEVQRYVRTQVLDEPVAL